MPPALPSASRLNIAALAAAFRDKSASYKFLWGQAILRAIEEGESARPIPIRRLAARMFDLAKYPLRRFLLSFGWHDRIDEALRNLEDAEGWHALKSEMLDTDIAARYADIPAFVIAPITAFVPYRLLTPFFSGELTGLGNAAKNRKIARLAAERFASANPPLYRFANSGEAIELHPAWRDYLLENMEILKGWAMWHWANYLQGRNPNVPAISQKLEKPDRRGAMKKQTEFWRWIIGLRAGEIRCIYSGEVLRAGAFSVDHFVPWDFIGHDLLWNLAPTKKEVNSAKSNFLPDDSYLPQFVKTQHAALSAFHSHRRDKWDSLLAIHFADLRLPQHATPDAANLCAAYSRIMPPLLNLAENCGFRRWRYAAA
jgi:hypothetical protein